MPGWQAPRTPRRKPSIDQYRACLSSVVASAIPRLANGLAASCAYPARLGQQAFDEMACAILRVLTKLLFVALTHLVDGRPRGHTFLDRIEGFDIVGLALRRHNILIASQAFPKANRVEINTEAICVDILATACAQQCRCAFKIHRLRRRRQRRDNREKKQNWPTP